MAGVEYTVLKGLNKNFEDEIAKNHVECLEKYKQYKAKNRIFNVKFVKITADKSAYEVDEDGCTLVLKMDECQNYRMAFKIKGLNTEKTFRVSVGSIDEENKKIYLLCDTVSGNLRNYYIRQIDDLMSKNQKVVLHAVVKGVLDRGEASSLTLDIEGVGIPGRMIIQDWSVNRTRSLSEIVKVGDIIPVRLMKKRRLRGSSAIYFECSRREVVEPLEWESVVERYPKGTIVTLTCVSCRPRNFFATIQGLDDLEVLCTYPQDRKDSNGNPISIDVGCDYKGYIARVDEKIHLLVCNILYKVQKRTDGGSNGRK